MPKTPESRGGGRDQEEIWLASLANLGKRLISTPPRVGETVPVEGPR